MKSDDNSWSIEKHGITLIYKIKVNLFKELGLDTKDLTKDKLVKAFEGYNEKEKIKNEYDEVIGYFSRSEDVVDASSQERPDEEKTESEKAKEVEEVFTGELSEKVFSAKKVFYTSGIFKTQKQYTCRSYHY